MTTTTKSLTALEMIEQQIKEIEADRDRILQGNQDWYDRQRLIAELRERRAMIIRATY